MKKHPHLKQAAAILQNQFHCHFLEANICEVSYEKGSCPFIFLTVDEAVFDGIGLSIDLSLDDTYSVAEIVITCMHAAPVALSDPFYISKNGVVHWNDEALVNFQLETDGDILKDMQPPTSASH